MEQKFYTDNFEYYLKQKSDEFSMIPRKRVWHSIYNNLHPSRKWPSAAASLLLFSTLVFIGYLNTNNHSQKSLLASKSINRTQSQDFNQLALNKTTTIIDKHVDASTTANNNFSNLTTIGINTNAQYTNSSITNLQTLNSKQKTASSVNKQSNKFELNNATLSIAKSNQKIVTNNLNQAPSVTAINENTIAINNNTISNNSNEISQPFESTINITSITEEKAAKEITAITTVAKENKNAFEISDADRKWMDNYAFENQARKNKWKAQTGWEIYVTPGVGYRTLSEKTNKPIANSLSTSAYNNTNINSGLNHTPSVALEAGVSMLHRFAKNVRWKVGAQLNYSSYNIPAFDLGHPVLATLQMSESNSGYPYLRSALTNTSSTIVGKPVVLTNSLLQISLPIGVDIRLAGKDKIQWFAGATVQGSYNLNAKANIISSDRNYYINDASMVRKFNLNTSFETFVTYKTNSGVILKAGPQFRYQPLSTYIHQLNITEKNYNIGLKLGVVKDF